MQACTPSVLGTCPCPEAEMIGLVAQEAVQRPTSCHAPYPEPVHQCWRGVSEHTRRVLALVALCRVLSAVLKSEAVKCGRAYRVGSGPREAQFFYIHEGGKVGAKPATWVGVQNRDSWQSASASSALGVPALGRAVGLPDRHSYRAARARGSCKSVRGGTRALTPAPPSSYWFQPVSLTG